MDGRNLVVVGAVVIVCVCFVTEDESTGRLVVTAGTVGVVVSGACPLPDTSTAEPDADPEVDPDDLDPLNVHTRYTSSQQSPLIKHMASQKQARISVSL